jgi:hypothetical protein
MQQPLLATYGIYSTALLYTNITPQPEEERLRLFLRKGGR